jgi:hypothetical protein
MACALFQCTAICNAAAVAAHVRAIAGRQQLPPLFTIPLLLLPSPLLPAAAVLALKTDHIFKRVLGNMKAPAAARSLTLLLLSLIRQQQQSCSHLRLR